MGGINMRMSEMLSDAGINALIKGQEIAKDELKEQFYSITITRLTKNWFWMEMTDKDGKTHKRIVKCNDKE